MAMALSTSVSRRSFQLLFLQFFLTFPYNVQKGTASRCVSLLNNILLLTPSVSRDLSTVLTDAVISALSLFADDS